jgi:hypothetical protein
VADLDGDAMHEAAVVALGTQQHADQLVVGHRHHAARRPEVELATSRLQASMSSGRSAAKCGSQQAL